MATNWGFGAHNGGGGWEGSWTLLTYVWPKFYLYLNTVNQYLTYIWTLLTDNWHQFDIWPMERSLKQSSVAHQLHWVTGKECWCAQWLRRWVGGWIVWTFRIFQSQTFIWSKCQTNQDVICQICTRRIDSHNWIYWGLLQNRGKKQNYTFSESFWQWPLLTDCHEYKIKLWQYKN